MSARSNRTRNRSPVAPSLATPRNTNRRRARLSSGARGITGSRSIRLSWIAARWFAGRLIGNNGNDERRRVICTRRHRVRNHRRCGRARARRFLRNREKSSLLSLLLSHWWSSAMNLFVPGCLPVEPVDLGWESGDSLSCRVFIEEREHRWEPNFVLDRGVSSVRWSVWNKFKKSFNYRAIGAWK